MKDIKLFSGGQLPLEMHKVRIVQKIELKPIERRLEAIKEAGNNTFLLRNRDVFLDMLTDSGVNAMSDRQLAAMMVAEDSYAGGESFYRLEAELKRVFKKKYFLPTHQGRACEHLISKVLIKQGDIIP
ncbi:MAG: beta-eliminating lyase-related protein, partial [Firmicutes bacterium]|nr:beta-eliminating lyase-related protein [Bacillota bacterium]